MINNKSIKTFVNNLHSIKNSPETTLRLVSDELVNFAEELKLGFMEITTEFHSPTLDESKDVIISFFKETSLVLPSSSVTNIIPPLVSISLAFNG